MAVTEILTLQDLASEEVVLTDEDMFFPEDWADYQDEREIELQFAITEDAWEQGNESCEWEAEQQLAYWD